MHWTIRCVERSCKYISSKDSLFWLTQNLTKTRFKITKVARLTFSPFLRRFTFRPTIFAWDWGKEIKRKNQSVQFTLSSGSVAFTQFSQHIFRSLNFGQSRSFRWNCRSERAGSPSLSRWPKSYWKMYFTNEDGSHKKCGLWVDWSGETWCYWLSISWVMML